MIIAIRTDKPVAEIYTINNDHKILNSYTWEAHRELSDTIHIKIKEQLEIQSCNFNDISGLIVFKGPGSFTGLRIGISVMNTLSYGLNVPIVGVAGDDWLQDGMQLLANGTNHNIVIPEYGNIAHITMPKK